MYIGGLPILSISLFGGASQKSFNHILAKGQFFFWFFSLFFFLVNKLANKQAYKQSSNQAINKRANKQASKQAIIHLTNQKALQNWVKGRRIVHGGWRGLVVREWELKKK